jgi:hypothetical protein
MLLVRRAIKWLGLVLTIAPVAPFLLMAAYIWFANPADQAGWGAGFFTMAMIAVVVVPIGLLLLLISFVLNRLAVQSPNQ